MELNENAINFGLPYSLNEMAQVTDPKHKQPLVGGEEIWIYGQDRSAMAPHFHFFDKKDKSKLNVEVRISDLQIIKSGARPGVPKNQLLTSKGIEDQMKRLYKWMNQTDFETGMRNFNLLKYQWNSNNRSNSLTNAQCAKAYALLSSIQ